MAGYFKSWAPWFFILSIPAFLLAVFWGYLLAAPDAADFGSFSGPPQLERTSAGMRLLTDLTYVDPRGGTWTAEAGFETDGATIPQVFWSIVGGPFDGAYLDAAIIHDWYVETQEVPWQDVHRIFYYASRAAGVGATKAKIMYGAVYLGGPRWGSGPSACYAGCHMPLAPDLAVPPGHPVPQGPSPEIPWTAEDAEAFAAWVAEESPSLEAIRTWTPPGRGTVPIP